MERIEEIDKILKENGIKIEENQTLRSFLTEQPEENFQYEKIVIFKTIDFRIKKEVIDIVNVLQEYVTSKYSKEEIDYYNHSERGCYLLSTLFALVTDWTLVQGEMNFKEEKNTYYHSWLEKDNVVYDPSLRIITSKDRYNLFFLEEDSYTKEELKDYIKKTGTFTYYRKDLQNGCVFPAAYLFVYDTQEALEIGERVILDVTQFVDENRGKRFDLTDEHYLWDDIDISHVIKDKAVHLANCLSIKEDIPFQKSYIEVINSRFFKRLETLENGLWILSYEELEAKYFETEKQYKK